MKKSRSVDTANVPEAEQFGHVERRLVSTRQQLPEYPVEHATLIRLTRHLDKRLHDMGNEALAPFDVNIATYHVLVTLYSSENKRLLASVLAETSGEKRANVTRICDELVAKKLIARTPGTTDRRSVVVSLTAAGQQLVESLASTMTQLMRKLYSDFNKEELRMFQLLLRRQLDHIDQMQSRQR